MTGIISNKNQLIVGMLQHKLNCILNSNSSLWIQGTTGSIFRLNGGFSYLLGDEARIAAEATYCHHQDKLSTRLSFNQTLSDLYRFEANVKFIHGSVKNKEINKIRSKKMTLGITKYYEDPESKFLGNIFGENLLKRTFGLVLK